MRSPHLPSRSAVTTVSANALTALVVIAAAVAAAPTANAAQVQSTAVWVEHSGVRTVAAAVAAAARDLLGSDHNASANYIADDGHGATPQRPVAEHLPLLQHLPGIPLRESLLDLPPPAC